MYVHTFVFQELWYRGASGVADAGGQKLLHPDGADVYILHYTCSDIQNRRTCASKAFKLSESRNFYIVI